MTESYNRAGPEPTIAELLADPIVRLTMRRDGVAETELRAVIQAGRKRLGYDRCGATQFRAGCNPVPPRRCHSHSWLKCA